MENDDNRMELLSNLARNVARAAKRVREAVQAAVPRDARLALSSPFEFQWPDGRKLCFTQLVSVGDHVFLAHDGPERARIDLLSFDDLETIAAKTPGAEYEPDKVPDNLIELPRNPSARS